MRKRENERKKAWDVGGLFIYGHFACFLSDAIFFCVFLAFPAILFARTPGRLILLAAFFL